jgi:SH2 domain/Zinc knuckle
MFYNDKWIDQNKFGRFFFIDKNDMTYKKIGKPLGINPKYLPRTILHKKFKNYSLMQTIEYLKDKDIGDFLFRPSSKGNDHITFTMKLFTSVYLHIDIEEEEKPPGASIGERLKISELTYNNLDEIITKYRDPIKKVVLDSITHRKFLASVMSIEQFEEEMQKQRTATPDAITYGFAIVPEYCQTMVLGYIAKKTNFIKEYIRLKPKGLLFHDSYFMDIDHLISYFKKNFTSFEYQKFIKKNNKPPVPTLASEIPKPLQLPEDKNYNMMWRNMDALPPEQPVQIPGREAYAPETDYHKSDRMENEKLYRAEGKFSTYRGNNSIHGDVLPNPVNTWADQPMPEGGQENTDFRGRKVECYTCHQEGHISKMCPKNKKVCFNCHGEGHFAKDCPNASTGQYRRKKSDREYGHHDNRERSRSHSHSEERRGKNSWARADDKPQWENAASKGWNEEPMKDDNAPLQKQEEPQKLADNNQW